MIIAIALLFFMGGYLILGKVPSQLKDSIYRSSRRVAGSIYLVCAVHIVISVLFKFRTMSSSMAPATCIVTYYLMALLFSWSFLRLVGDNQTFRRQRVILYLSLWGGYSALLLSLVYFLDAKYASMCVIGAAVIYILIVVFIVYFFRKTYKAALVRAECYYSESVETVIAWVSNSVKHLVLLGVMGGISAFCPAGFIVVYAIYGVGILIYIYSNFMIMMIDIPELVTCQTDKIPEFIFGDESVDMMSASEENSFDSRAPLVYQMIDEKMLEWIELKRYLQNGVSVIGMACEMCTNRTYLSRYINEKYGVSFRDWILSLRIDEAKRIMLDDDRVHISQVADRVGFTSPASFTRAFTRSEGVPPVRWRELNCGRLGVK